MHHSADGRLLTIDEVVEAHILYAIRTSDGNRESAARRLGIGTRTIYRYIRKMKARQQLVRREREEIE